MLDSKTASSEINPSIKFQLKMEKKQPLMYLSITCRSDIAFATSYLSQFNDCYTSKEHCQLKNVLRYLKASVTFGLVYRKSDSNIIGFEYFDLDNDLNDKNSFSSFICKANVKILKNCRTQVEQKLRNMSLTGAGEEADSFFVEVLKETDCCLKQ